MKTTVALMLALFVTGFVLGSLVFPLPRYKGQATGLVLDTWTGKYDTYGAQMKRAATPEQASATP